MGFLCCLDNSTSNFTPNFQMSSSILESAQIVEQERVKGKSSKRGSKPKPGKEGLCLWSSLKITLPMVNLAIHKLGILFVIINKQHFLSHVETTFNSSLHLANESATGWQSRDSSARSQNGSRETPKSDCHSIL